METEKIGAFFLSTYTTRKAWKRNKQLIEEAKYVLNQINQEYHLGRCPRYFLTEYIENQRQKVPNISYMEVVKRAKSFVESICLLDIDALQKFLKAYLRGD